MNQTIHAALAQSQRRNLAYAPRGRNEQQALLRASRREQGEICSPYPGLYVISAWWAELSVVRRARVILETLALLHPKWVFCSVSAAVILGICDSNFLLDGCVHIAAPHNCRRRSTRWLKVHYFPQAEMEGGTFRSLRITSPRRTVFDCSRQLPFEDALGIIDAALRAQLIRKGEFLRYCQSRMKYRNAVRALIFASYGDGFSENGGESYARSQMIRLGFVPPQLQVIFHDPIRNRDSRVDFFWAKGAFGPVVFEFHGRQKYVDPEMTRGRSVNFIETAEEKRAHRLSLHGVQVDDIDFKDVRNLAGLRRELEAYGVPRRPRARAGILEFNREVECPREHFPRSITL